MRGGAFLKVKEGRVGFRKMTSAERYCNEEQYYGGFPAHLKQRKISVLRLSLYNPNNRTASTFYNTQSNYD